MKAIWPAIGCLITSVVGFEFGREVASPAPNAAASQTLIARAQKSSIYGSEPIWINQSDKEPWVRQARGRAYAFCFRDRAIDRACAAEQDEAVRNAVLALNVAEAQRHMADKNRLGVKERFVAEHSEIILQVRSYCWELYKAHGAMDARLLAVCFGNLTGFSPLIPLPVP